MKKINLQRDIDSRTAISTPKIINQQLPLVVERKEDEATELNEEVQADKTTKKSGKRKTTGVEEASEV